MQDISITENSYRRFLQNYRAASNSYLSICGISVTKRVTFVSIKNVNTAREKHRRKQLICGRFAKYASAKNPVVR